MPFEENQFFMNQFIGEEQFPGIAQQFERGEVNNFVNHRARIGDTRVVENVNYYDTYHHRINNYHTMDTNRYRDHYVDHNIYYHNTRNIYDGADYNTVSGNIVDRERGISNEGYSTIQEQGNYRSQEQGNYRSQEQGNYRRFPGCGCRQRRDEDDRRRDFDDRDRRRDFDDRDRRRDFDDRDRKRDFDNRDRRKNCEKYIY